MRGRWITYSQDELAWVKAFSTEPRAIAHALFVQVWNRPDVSLVNFHAMCKRKGWTTGRTGQFVKGVRRDDNPARKGHHPVGTAALLAELTAAQKYRYIGKDGKPVLARDLEDRIEQLEAAIDSIETSHGLTSNGNLWRFWSRMAQESAAENTKLRHHAEYWLQEAGKLHSQVATLTDQLTRATQNNDMMFAKGMHHGQQVMKDTRRLVIVDSPELVELREALTRANAATAAAYEVAAATIEMIVSEAQKEVGSIKLSKVDAAVVEMLNGIANSIRALATPDQTAALDKLIAEAVGPLINAADAMLDAFCVHEDSAQIAASAGMMTAILAASKKGGA